MKAYNMNAILKRLVLARKNAGYTQADVAKLLGKNNHSAICNWERGTNFLFSDFLRMCELYNISPAWVITGISDEDEIMTAGYIASQIDRFGEIAREILDALPKMDQA